jgi:glutathionylspermidine synthase
MIRRLQAPRASWKSIVESQGLIYHTPDGQPYWDESAYYEFTLAEVDAIEAATNELWSMWLEAIGVVIERNRFAELRIPAAAVPAIVASWNDETPALHGRFDLACDGRGGIKALEFNADTPTALLEAAVIQWHWQQDTHQHADQFNSIHEKLLAKLGEIRPHVSGSPLYFAHAADTEDMITVTYLRDLAQQAGYETHALTVAEIGWNGREFVDLANRPMRSIYKLYPWEWLFAEAFGANMIASFGATQWIEPPWKLVASNKGILAVLWELYPRHPFLLEAYLDSPRNMRDYAQKPFFSREGANVTLVRGGSKTASTAGDYGGGGFVYQARASIPSFSGRYPVVGSWHVIDQGACGMGIRESDTPITNNLSRFVPHIVR